MEIYSSPIYIRNTDMSCPPLKFNLTEIAILDPLLFKPEHIINSREGLLSVRYRYIIFKSYINSNKIKRQLLCQWSVLPVKAYRHGRHGLQLPATTLNPIFTVTLLIIALPWTQSILYHINTFMQTCFWT